MDFGRNTSNGSTGVLILVLIGVTVALIIGGFLIAQLTPLAFPVQASAESEQIDELFKVLLGIGGGIFLLVQGLLLYSVLRFRVPDNDTRDGPTIHGNVTLEMVWTAIPSVIVLVLVIYSYQVWVDIRQPRDNEVVVRAVGRQFAWTFEYQDPRVDRLMAANTLYTYVGQPIRMELLTEDVIHSFWIPAMRVKQDLLPGRQTEIRFTPTEPGVYRVVCAELCGAGHGDMFSFIEVFPDEATYEAAFLDPLVELVLNPPEDPVIRGAQLLASGAYPCAGCHALQDTRDNWVIDWQGATGPVLNGIGDRAALRVAGQTAEEYLYESLYYPGAYVVRPFNNLMPQFQPHDPAAPNYMPPDDVRAVVAYLCTLTETGESACDLENLDAYMEADLGGS